MTFEHRTGDLFEEGLEAIAHGVNCKGVMGAGIATVFRDDFPEMFEAYRKLCKGGKLKPGMVYPWFDEELELWVFNLATQPTPGPTADLAAIRLTVQKMLAFCEKKGIESVGLPRIGSGLGGLEWDDVRATIEEVAESSPVHLVIVSLP